MTLKTGVSMLNIQHFLQKNVLHSNDQLMRFTDLVSYMNKYTAVKEFTVFYVYK